MKLNCSNLINQLKSLLPYDCCNEYAYVRIVTANDEKWLGSKLEKNTKRYDRKRIERENETETETKYKMSVKQK